MADRASDSVVIGADKAAVMAVIADFEAYPQWASSVKQAEVLDVDADGRPLQVRFLLDAGIIKDDYVLAYDWSRPDEVSWNQVRSKAMKSQDGAYRLVETPDGTEVTYALALDLKIPMLGAFKRKGQQAVIETALKGLKKRVESAG